MVILLVRFSAQIYLVSSTLMEMRTKNALLLKFTPHSSSWMNAFRLARSALSQFVPSFGFSCLNSLLLIFKKNALSCLLRLFGATKLAKDNTGRNRAANGFGPPVRSYEHTSELQSLMRISYAVFCLKTTNTHSRQTKHHRIK